MLHQTDGLSLQSPLRPLSVLLFHLLLIHSCRGQSQLIGSSQPIVATLGDDIILPCHLEPAEDALGLTLEWTRPDLNPRFVYVRRSGQELVGKKHESFEGRTSLFIDELKMGNISLKLSKVTLADQGTYRCFILQLGLETLVQLVAVSGAVSSPVITLAGIDEATSGVILQCESAGWYPEPEVLWLDGEGKLVSVGPTETVRGPDDLYTVSSRVTVEKRHSNNFTCRVQQQNINQTRETHIHVLDDFFEVQSSYSPVTVVLAVSLAVCIVFSSAVVFFVCKWRQKIKTKRSRSEETLMEGNRAAPASSSWLTSWNLYKWFKDEHQRRVEAETKVDSLTADVQKLKDEKEQLIKELETKNKELQEEKTRREEAEEEVENLKTELQTKVESLKDVLKLKEEKEKSEKQLKKELETKNKKVESLTADVQKLKEEMEKSEKQLETKNKEVESLKDVLKLKEEKEKSEKQLKKELETKNKKVDSLTADVQKLKEEKEKSEKQLKKELETKNKKVESLTADVQKLKEEKEKSEKQLETKKQELQDEKTRREKAEKQVENLKTELQTKQDNSSSASLSSRGNVQ
ncbi:butyrophilin subfamily 2 member A1-like isoform X9 [Siniperca chuatsi]|uniref:butyrophilin subfamily 2 member A1-like isoform X9 n=1 Tax=Siniperca chuatsi TaxID=119488 RepID=UPI001CE1ECE9|nr:butyrophilin subfamily 2 member A1-like isoform X9 [Siniperca chuatsi]